MGLTDAVEIGRGGYAVVYRAFQPAFERFVAVKLFSQLALDEATPAVFARECRAIGRMSGRSNILTVHDAGTTTSGQPYLIMAYMARGSLEDRLEKEGPLPWPEAIEIGVKLAKALEVAHQVGVLHRDVKPDNILVSDDGDPMLADFGIARLTDVTRKTASGPAYTPAHAAPEVIGGEPPTISVDIYSLASTLFALIVGHPAFVERDDDPLFLILRRILEDPVPDLLRPRMVPEGLCRSIEAGMAKDPSDRPQSAGAFGVELEAARQAATRQEAATEEAVRLEAAKEVAARQEAARQVAARQEEARQEVARQEVARDQAARQEKAREQAARQVAARQEVAREQAARTEVARQVAAGEQAARREAAHAQVASDEALRALLKRRAARREAAQQDFDQEPPWSSEPGATGNEPGFFYHASGSVPRERGQPEFGDSGKDASPSAPDSHETPTRELVAAGRWRKATVPVVATIVLASVVGLLFAIVNGSKTFGTKSSATTLTTATGPTTTLFRPGFIGTPLPRAPAPGLIAFTNLSDKSGENGIWVIAPDGSGLRQIDAITPSCGGSGCWGSLRRDGRAILFSGSPAGIKTINVDGTDLKTVDPSGSCQSGCDWSPDGRSIVYLSGPAIGISDIVLAAADGSSPSHIGVGSGPSWSQDGKMIAFEDKFDNIELFDLSSRTTRVRTTSQIGLSGLSFDPTGTRVGVIGAGKLQIGDTTSATLQPACAAGGTLSGPGLSWSPDGASIVFTIQGPLLADQLAICDIASGKVRTLPQVGYSQQSPSWR